MRFGVVEFFGEFVLIVVGVVCMYMVLLIVRVVRRAIMHLDNRVQVEDPDGRAWWVRVSLVPEPIWFAASRRAFGMTDSQRRKRRTSGVREDDVSKSEIVHPARVMSWDNEGVGCVGPILLAVFLVALAVFLVELVVLVVLVIVFSVAVSFVRRWQCEVVDPEGTRYFVHAGSLRDARRVRDETVHHIEAGIWSPS